MQFFFVPTFEEGGGVGGDVVGTKSQVFPKISFEGVPYEQIPLGKAEGKNVFQ